MKFIIVDMQKVRGTLPPNGTVELVKEQRGFKINCKIRNPSLVDMFKQTFEKEFERIKNKQREVLGDALHEFHCFNTGGNWDIYLKRIPLEIINI